MLQANSRSARESGRCIRGIPKREGKRARDEAGRFQPRRAERGMNGAALSREDQTIKRQPANVFRRGGFVSSQERDPRMAAGRAVSATFPQPRPRSAMSLQPRIGYDLILARPMPPPSVGKASFMRGHFHHRTNCSSTKHKEGLRSLLAIGGSFDEAVCAPLSFEA